MYFTEQDFKKIQNWLKAHSVKDIEFPNADLPLTGEETVAIVQQGENRNVSVSQLLYSTVPAPPDSGTDYLSLKINIEGTSIMEYVAAGENPPSLVSIKIINDGNSLGEDFTNPTFTLTRTFVYDSGKTLTRTDKYYTNSVTLTDSIVGAGYTIYSITGASVDYKGTKVNISSASKTFYYVKASYIGYTTDTDNAPTSIKLVKRNIAGTYTVSNTLEDFAKLVIAIPKNGGVKEISSIYQVTDLMNVSQKYEIVDSVDGNYTLYVCTSGHKIGDYQFKIS